MSDTLSKKGTPSSSLIPDAFPNAQKTNISENGSTLLSLANIGKNRVGGVYNELSPYLFGSPQAAVVPTAPPSVKMHELGHSIWFNDLTTKQRSDWTSIHNQEISSGSSYYPFTPDYYKNSPAHSFAEVYSQYATQPRWLQSKSVSAYNFLKGITGFEYMNAGPLTPIHHFGHGQQ